MSEFLVGVIKRSLEWSGEAFSLADDDPNDDVHNGFSRNCTLGTEFLEGEAREDSIMSDVWYVQFSELSVIHSDVGTLVTVSVTVSSDAAEGTMGGIA